LGGHVVTIFHEYVLSAAIMAGAAMADAATAAAATPVFFRKSLRSIKKTPFMAMGLVETEHLI
jgi:hypothetical protein